MRRRKDCLPIILSHNTHTGIMVFPNRKMGGRDMAIVGLNKDIPSGQSFEMEDIEWIKAVLHFADTKSLKITVDNLTLALKKWKSEENNEQNRTMEES